MKGSLLLLHNPGGSHEVEGLGSGPWPKPQGQLWTIRVPVQAAGISIHMNH